MGHKKDRPGRSTKRTLHALLLSDDPEAKVRALEIGAVFVGMRRSNRVKALRGMSPEVMGFLLNTQRFKDYV